MQWGKVVIRRIVGSENLANMFANHLTRAEITKHFCPIGAQCSAGSFHSSRCGTRGSWSAEVSLHPSAEGECEGQLLNHSWCRLCLSRFALAFTCVTFACFVSLASGSRGLLVSAAVRHRVFAGWCSFIVVPQYDGDLKLWQVVTDDLHHGGATLTSAIHV